MLSSVHRGRDEINANSSSDVTPRVNAQLSRAAALILSSLSFIHDLRNGTLQDDAVRGTSLDMSQYKRLFGTCRVPTDVGQPFLAIWVKLTRSGDAVWKYTKKADILLCFDEDNSVSIFSGYCSFTNRRLVRLPRLKEPPATQRQRDLHHTSGHRQRRR